VPFLQTAAQSGRRTRAGQARGKKNIFRGEKFRPSRSFASRAPALSSTLEMNTNPTAAPV
jgi:hypothetical protein